MRHFVDDPGYLDWVSRRRDGFVVNTNRWRL